ncbi:MAG TPA: class I SAM-dependent methyltransferase [Anaerolineales bacterium]|nr:class I SAM-dependent methyltransferase [Anaerolineales bacterium]
MPNPIYTEIELPEIVQKANELANELGFPLMPEGRPAGHKGPPSACITQVGRLLQVLASGKPGGRIGEQGTGAGVGTAWLASGLGSEAKLISVEIDIKHANAVAKLFAAYPNVEIRIGDWRDVMSPQEPYDLLFVDAMPRADLVPSKWDAITDLLKIGGQIVMDDLVPVELWPADWDEIVDAKRQYAFANPRVRGTEVLTTPSTSALIITRIK